MSQQSLHHSHQFAPVAMPKQLLGLPQDVLDQLLGDMLPPLQPDATPISLHDLRRIPDPFDLHNLMLTCKALYGMGYPWAWRQLQVFDVDAPRGSRRWRYIVDHPEAAVHVRLFMVDLLDTLPKSENFVFGLILKATQSMQNIRVLIYRQGVSQLGSQIFEDLISKPHLHTLSTAYKITFSNVSPPRSLKRFTCISEPSPGWTFDSAPNLESFSLQGQGWFPGKSSIPWASLRDIEVCGTENLTVILDSFTAWKKTYPSMQSPLQEATFHHSIRPQDMCRIFDTFRGQHITSLRFDTFPFLDAAFIQRLVEEFPHVRRLGLMTADIALDWRVELIEIAQKLGRLRRLTWLQWNYAIWPSANAAIFDRSSLKAQFPVLTVLEDHCATSLRRIDLRDGDKTYSYERAEGGSFPQEECSLSRSVTLHNDSWSCEIYDGI